METTTEIANLSPIVEYNETEQALAQLQHKYNSAVYDVTTKQGYLAATLARRELRELRVALEKRRGEVKAPVIEQGRLIDAEAKRITALLEALEKPIDAQIQQQNDRNAAEKAERERVEAERVAKIRNAIGRISNEPARLAGAPSTQIEERLAQLRAVVLDPTNYGEFFAEAEQALADMLPQLEGLLALRIRVEAEQAQIEADRAELARLKAEQAAREAEQAERDAAAKAAADAERAQADAAAAAAREEADRAARVERERLAAQQQRIARIRGLGDGIDGLNIFSLKTMYGLLMEGEDPDTNGPLLDGIDDDHLVEAEAALVATTSRVLAAVEAAQKRIDEDAERERLQLQAVADAKAAAEDRARLEADMLANITLHDAALAGRDLLVGMGLEDHVVTRGLTAALERS